MGGINERREQRYGFQIPVTISSRQGDMTLVSENVSYRGIFLRSDTPPPKMQIIRARIRLPTQTTEIVTHVVVVHVAGAGARVPGVGVCFFGLDGEARVQWERFIDFVRQVERSTTDAVLAAGHTEHPFGDAETPAPISVSAPAPYDPLDDEEGFDIVDFVSVCPPERRSESPSMI
jgi:hypothetical protein